MRAADLASLVGKRARFGNLVVLQAVVVGRSRSAADAPVRPQETCGIPLLVEAL